MLAVLYIDGLKHTPIDVCGPPRGIQPLLYLIICPTVNLTRENRVRARICLECVCLYILLRSVQNGDLESLGRRAAFTRTPPRADIVLCSSAVSRFICMLRVFELKT